MYLSLCGNLTQIEVSLYRSYSRFLSGRQQKLRLGKLDLHIAITPCRPCHFLLFAFSSSDLFIIQRAVSRQRAINERFAAVRRPWRINVDPANTVSSTRLGPKCRFSLCAACSTPSLLAFSRRSLNHSFSTTRLATFQLVQRIVGCSIKPKQLAYHPQLLQLHSKNTNHASASLRTSFLSSQHQISASPSAPTRLTTRKYKAGTRISAAKALGQLVRLWPRHLLQLPLRLQLHPRLVRMESVSLQTRTRAAPQLPTHPVDTMSMHQSLAGKCLLRIFF